MKKIIQAIESVRAALQQPQSLRQAESVQWERYASGPLVRINVSYILLHGLVVTDSVRVETPGLSAQDQRRVIATFLDNIT